MYQDCSKLDFRDITNMKSKLLAFKALAMCCQTWIFKTDN